MLFDKRLAATPNRRRAAFWRGFVISCLICISPVLWAGETPDAETVADESGSGGWKIDGWSLSTSLYTKHFDPEPGHVNHQHLIGPEI